MTPLTRAQRLALKRVYDRGELYLTPYGPRSTGPGPKLSYRAFRKRAHVSFGLDCILVQWNGMWLGIERDGYVHS